MTAHGPRSAEERLERQRAENAADARRALAGQVRDVKVIVLAGGILIASVAFGGWRYIEGFKTKEAERERSAVIRDAGAQERSHKLRAVSCYNAWSLTGTGPDDCLEPAMRPYFQPSDVPVVIGTRAHHEKTWDLVCGFLRQSEDGRAFVLKLETEQGVACEDPPKGGG